METTADVIIVGAGPAGLATAACLVTLSISFMVLEKEECFASLWKCRAYDRLKLHIAKRFCSLPHFSYPKETPTFISREAFVGYLEDYVHYFELNPIYRMKVVMATFDIDTQRWLVNAQNLESDEVMEFQSKFLVVATGENAEPVMPTTIPGIDSFPGDIMHSSAYKSGAKYARKNILVVGAGNSGMEIAYDLSDFGAKTSILVRSQVYYGDLNQYGIIRPIEGPFSMKTRTGKSPVIDVGTVNKIKLGEIKVLNTTIAMIHGNRVFFEDGTSHHFDAIVYATGYRSKAYEWLKNGGDLLNENGYPNQNFPRHWKGKHGVYCAGLGRNGLIGVAMDAELIAKDICETMKATGTQ